MMNMMQERNNYYEVLEVEPSATLQEIHNAYVRAKNAYSGDSAALYSLMSQDECDKILEQIEEAYSILGIAEKRREYDKARGFNQSFTPEGFQESIDNRPDYKPVKQEIDKSVTTAKLHDEIIQQKAQREEFRYQQEHSSRNEASVSKIHAVKKFGLHFDEDPVFEQEIENCTEFTGEFLQRIREYKKVTVERMADMTKISKTYIKHIEADDTENLPAPVYTRGFVYQYAKVLKLNPEIVATSYLHHIKRLKAPQA